MIYHNFTTLEQLSVELYPNNNYIYTKNCKKFRISETDENVRIYFLFQCINILLIHFDT